MKPTRRMWISTGAAGVVLAGGVVVAATAFAGGVDRVQVDTADPGAGTSTYAPGRAPGEVPGRHVPKEAEPTRSPAEFVVSTRLNEDPRDVAEFWTKDRLESAEPLPMPINTVRSESPGGPPGPGD